MAEGGGMLDIRLYAGFAGQSGRIAAVHRELEILLESVAGLRRFRLLETPEGLAMLTEAETRAACDECARCAEQWMAERVPGLSDYRPLTAVGDVIADVRGGG
jgi:hypothetical protein